MNQQALLKELERECLSDQAFAQEVARLAPQWFHSRVQWYGIAVFHGSRTYRKKGKWVVEGGKWRAPQHGRDHAFLSFSEAKAHGDKEYGQQVAWLKERGIDQVTYRVEPMGPKPGEKT